jgi:hypothetical protein
MCLRRAPEKYIAGAALDRAANVVFNFHRGSSVDGAWRAPDLQTPPGQFLSSNLHAVLRQPNNKGMSLLLLLPKADNFNMAMV